MYFTGKYYYEGTVTDDGLCRLGWSAANAALDLGTNIIVIFTDAFLCLRSYSML